MEGIVCEEDNGRTGEGKLRLHGNGYAVAGGLCVYDIAIIIDSYIWWREIL